MSKMRTRAITLWFPKQCLLGFFILEKQLASQDMFLVRSELSITAYLFLVLYRSTSLWCKPPRNVSYKHTFGAPDQGQTLDVWGSQTAESALTWQTRYVAPRHILELTLEVILDHKIRIKTMTLVFSPGSCSKSLSLLKESIQERKICSWNCPGTRSW